MDCSLFLIFNHEITPRQKEDTYISLGVKHIIELPKDLKVIWSSVPPDLHSIEGYLEPVKTWLLSKAGKGDYTLIQGDFGACFILVNLAFKLGLIPIYSTTNREAVETYNNDGSVKLVHQFRHQLFRRYGV